MTALEVGGRRRRLITFVAALAATTLFAGWIGAHGWLPRHVQTKTGLTKVPETYCIHCHVRGPAPATAETAGPTGHVSPTDLVVSPDGAFLYVAAQDPERLLEIDLSARSVSRSFELPGRPHAVTVSADGTRLATTIRHRDRVWWIDLETPDSATLYDLTEPLGVALSEDGTRAFVADGVGNALVSAELATDVTATRVPAGNQPYAVALSADGTTAAVAARLAHPVPPGVEASSDVTFIDSRSGRVRARRELSSAHMAEGIAIAADGSFALAGVIRVRNLLPLTQVARGAVMNSALAFVESGGAGRVAQLPLDEPNAYFADPSDVVMTPDERVAFVASAGTNTITVVDLAAARRLIDGSDPAALEQLADDLGASAAYVTGRIPTRALPKALALDPAGERLYVAEKLADSIAVIDVGSLEVIDRIELGPAAPLTAERRGEIVFHDATVTFQSQFSCRSCHPDGQADALIWDFEIDGMGRNLVDTRSLQGIARTAPFKWNGKNPDLHTQCGPRFSMVLTRSEPFPEQQLDDLVTYIESLPLAPPRIPRGQEEAVERGRALFFREHASGGTPIPVENRCVTCHRPPLFTLRMPTDVGTGGSFDTPHLLGVGTTAPYLHDGRALTLEEIWTVHSPQDEHGVTNDLTKVELNDLVIYLRSL